MNEKLVTNLKLSKKLFELGVRVESEFWWCNTPDGYELRALEDIGGTFDRIPALLIGELGMMLPLSHDCYTLKIGDEWLCDWEDGYDGPTFKTLIADTEANARAMCLIYLIEQGLIKAEDIKL